MQLSNLLILSFIFFSLYKSSWQILNQDDSDSLNLSTGEYLSIIENLDSPLSVISIIGPYRSGKSFLANQLFGLKESSKGNESGFSASNCTKGVWIDVLKLQDRNVVILDFEGLFAPGNSESYDSKLFSLATTLSSLLIYNSVRTIDSLRYFFLILQKHHNQELLKN